MGECENIITLFCPLPIICYVGSVNTISHGSGIQRMQRVSLGKLQNIPMEARELFRFWTATKGNFDIGNGEYGNPLCIDNL